MSTGNRQMINNCVRYNAIREVVTLYNILSRHFLTNLSVTNLYSFCIMLFSTIKGKEMYYHLGFGPEQVD